MLTIAIVSIVGFLAASLWSLWAQKESAIRVALILKVLFGILLFVVVLCGRAKLYLAILSALSK